MNPVALSISEFSGADPELAKVVQHLTESIQRGDLATVERVVQQYPQYAALFDKVLPAIHALVHVGQPIAAEGRPARSDGDEDPQLTGTLGDFRIHQEIGRGGMGVVYEAEQISLGRLVALKVLPFAGMLDERQLLRFKNEAKAAAMLKHPNIVSVYSVGCDRAVHFYAMELVAGRSLSQVIGELRAAGQASSSQNEQHRVEESESSPKEPPDGGVPGTDTPNQASVANRANRTSSVADPSSATGRRLEPSGNVETEPMATLSTQHSARRQEFFRTIARLGIQAADALAYAHSEGVVHRDIKPSNLILDQRAKLWITDFGLAQIQSDHSLTLTGDLIGTLRYMSPEQAEGRKLIDHRTDVYSLGVTLYELLTLRPAFPSEDRQRLIRQIGEREPARPSHFDGAIPIDLETIVLKAMAKETYARYDSASELGDDLRRFLDHKAIKARPLGQTERLSRWVRRNPVMAALSASVFALLLLLSIGGIAVSLNLAAVAEKEARSHAATAQKLYVADMNLAQAAEELGDFGRAVYLLKRHLPGDGRADLRGFEWYYIDTECGGATRARILAHNITPYCVQYSPDGRLIASCDWDGKIYLWDALSRRKLKEIQGHRDVASGLAFSPDSRLLFTGGRNGALFAWDVASGTKVDSIPREVRDEIRSLALSPDGKLVAVGHGTGFLAYPSDEPAYVSVWNTQSKQRVAELEGLTGRVRSVAFSADSRWLSAGCHDGKLRVWDTNTWHAAATVESHSHGIFAVAFSPTDGNTLVTGSGVGVGNFVAGEIKIWDVPAWTVRRTIAHHGDVVTALAFSPDGQLLAAGSRDYSVSLWDANRDEDECITTVFGHGGEVKWITFSPDGTSLCSASNDDVIRVWTVEDLLAHSQTNSDYRGHEREIMDIAFSPDGKTVYSADNGGTVKMWNALSGETIRTWTEHIGPSINLDVSPCGRFLAVASGNFRTKPAQPGDLRLYDIRHDSPIWIAEMPGRFKGGVAFSPRGEFIAAGCVDRLMIWKGTSGRLVKESGPVDRHVTSVRFSPDGAQLACTTRGGKTYFFDTREFRLLAERVSDTNDTMGIGFSPDGSHFATGGSDKAIKLWDATTFQLVRSFDKTPDWVFSLDFSPDGQRIVSSGKDGPVRIWHTDTGESTLTLKGHLNWVWKATFSPDGRTVAAGGFDPVVRLWRAGAP